MKIIYDIKFKILIIYEKIYMGFFDFFDYLYSKMKLNKTIYNLIILYNIT